MTSVSHADLFLHAVSHTLLLPCYGKVSWSYSGPVQREGIHQLIDIIRWQFPFQSCFIIFKRIQSALPGEAGREGGRIQPPSSNCPIHHQAVRRQLMKAKKCLYKRKKSVWPGSMQQLKYIIAYSGRELITKAYVVYLTMKQQNQGIPCITVCIVVHLCVIITRLYTCIGIGL